METFNDILENTVALLNSKGYDDQTLNSFVGMDHFAKIYEEKLVDAVSKGNMQMSSQVFGVHIHGLYNQDTEIVHFGLWNHFDYPSNKFVLKVLIAQMREETLYFEVGGNAINLPTSEYVHTELLQAEKLRLQSLSSADIELISDRDLPDHFLKLVEREIKNLLTKGYLNHHNDEVLDPDTFFKYFVEQATSITRRTLSPPELLIVSNRLKKSQAENAPHLRIAYRVDPYLMSLQLYGVKAQLGSFSELVLTNKSTKLPLYDKMHQTLHKMKYIRSVKEMFDRTAIRQEASIKPKNTL